ncbi:SDR family NAD(P)-dependent oxidoreductase [Micromonospora aurantiaca (nom. illeg.)]|uniref:SDR family NAD(P)-dependent oxidoreductase n=1 Tax=Micromonospora aurantiaca (nom. illeg.) TaxID=47850 RepID=UPI003EBEF25A
MRPGERQIAVVGLACRYPDADDPAQLWRSVLARRRAFRAIPATRLDPEHRLGAPHAPESTYVRRAGLLRDWHFDREAFRVSGSSWRAADHTHWLALETAAAALCDAGFPSGAGLDADRVGVILGNSLTGEFTRAGLVRLHWPFVRRSVEAALRQTGVDPAVAAQVLDQARRGIAAAFPEPGDESLAGALSNTIAGRICNHFDFHGTGYTVDGACASSLLAVVTAANALLSGELNFALAGGVDLSLDPLEMIGFARLGALADGEMRVYDERPTGFLPGEGCGIVALMRADEAERRGLRVYARLTGWATSSDGSGGLTRPDAGGQALALRRAYRMAGLAPEQIALIEGHGTGTAVGDRVELETLAGIRRHAPGAAALGSVKANIGHTKAAAGAAALIKTVLAAYHRVLPPTTGCETPHPLLRAPDATLRVLDEPEPWPGGRLAAGVSAMGFGGINSHVVVENADPAAVGRRRLPPSVRSWSRRPVRPEILLIEAATTAELAERLDLLGSWGATLSDAEVGDVAATLAAGAGGTAGIRCALVAGDADELSAAARAATGLLATWDGRVVVDEAAGVALGGGPPARVGLLLPGQGAPVRYDAGPLARLLGDLPEGPAATGATGTEAAQPAVVWQSLLGLAWLDQLGCAPVGAVGHSLGELTALAWAGALDPGRLVALAAARGRVMEHSGVPGTGMVSLSVDETRAIRLADEHGLVVAALNAPDRTVLAGADENLTRLAAALRDSEVEAIRLPVSHAFHSPAMEPALPTWAAELNTVEFAPPARSVTSTVTGADVRTVDDLAALLTRQLTAPVRFAAAARDLGQRCDLLVEAGPGTVLSRLVTRFLPVPAVSLDCGGPPRSLALATAAVVVAGAGDLAAWYDGRPYRPLRPGAAMTFLSSPCGAGISRAGLPGSRSTSADAERDSPPGRVEQPSSVAAAVVRTASARPAPTPPEADPAGSVDPAGSAPRPDDPLGRLRAHLAAELELPVAGITPASRLLGDLHLNSLQVARTVAAVAAALGRQPPAAPLSLADATVAEAAEVLAQLPAAGDDEAPAQGLAPWVRLFRHDWVPLRGPLSGPPAAGSVRWRVEAPAGHPLHTVFPAVPDGTATSHGLAVALGPDDGPEQVAALLARIAGQRPARLAIVHDDHPAAAAVGRSAAAEISGCAVTVLDVSADGDVGLLAGLAVPAGYAELRAGPGGVQRLVTSVHRPAEETREVPLGPGDVCVVTGGATGITAFAAAAVAERTGCRLVVLGRRPAEDAETGEALRRLRTVLGDDRLRYERVDLTDPDAVREVLGAGRLGPVRAVVHGAGINRPAQLTDVTAGDLREHLGGKVTGLRSVLDAVGPDLRLVLAFGSIIGRQGLAGQAAYCIGNEWLRHDVEQWAGDHPETRVHLVEWSVWSGIGMGVRLDVLDSLRRRGVAGIAPDDGVAALWRILTDPTAPVTVLCTAAFPESGTLSPAPAPGTPEPGRLRFAESVVGRVGQVATVTEAVLSVGADPYLREHRVGDAPLLPAVLGLEAMAQVAALTTGSRAGWAVRDASFAAPIDVPERRTRRIRVAALAAETGGDVAVAIRADTDGFATDRFAGTVTDPPAPPAAAATADDAAHRPESPVDSGREATTPHPWYGPVLFHEGRMRRLTHAGPVSAFAVRATVDADDRDRWFASFLGQELLLGSPGGHDAAIHALLACAPHRRVLPVGAAEVVVWRPLRGRLTVEAREVRHSADEYVFDVDVAHAGVPVARWRGLRLRAVGDNREFAVARSGGRLGAELVGPWLTRRLIEAGAVDAVELVVGPGRREADGARRLLARHLAVPEADVDHQPSGALHVPGRYASASYADGQVLVALADRPVGVDWEPVTHRPPAGLLDDGARASAEELGRRTGDDPAVAATRLWAAREALVKLGADPEQVLAHGEPEPDGLLVSTGRDLTVVTVPAWADGATRVAVAVATRPVAS